MSKNTFYGNPLKFLIQLYKSGPYPREVYSKWIIFALRSFIVYPAALWEQCFKAKKIENRSIYPPPIFILGHYRSGTTLLHKILAQDPQFVYLDGMDGLFPFAGERIKKILTPAIQWLFKIFNIKNLAFHHYDFQVRDPIEEDAYMIYTNCPYSAFWGLIFPREAEIRLKKYILFPDDTEKEKWKEAYLFLCKKIVGKGRDKSLLLKSPPNTGRIKILLKLFPDARFIHIVRNPYYVYSSMQNLVVENIDPFYSLHATSFQQKQELIFSHYRLLMDQLLAQTALLNTSQFIEVQYESFMKDPLKELEHIYDQLNLGTFADIEPLFRNVLQKEARYTSRNHLFPPALKKQIRNEWGKYIDHWAYEAPKDT